MQTLVFTTLIPIFLFICSSVATTFQSSCTLPPNGTNIVYGGNVRGTFDILWGCLSTLLVCTWTVQHLRIPQATSKRKSLRGYWSHWGEEIGLQFKWMILTLLIPELLAGKELQDLVMARESCRAMKSFADEDGIEWSITQAYYANLGGYVLEFQNGDQREEQRQQNSCEKAGNLVNNDPHQNAATHIFASAERIFRTQNQRARALSNGIKTLFGGLPKESKEDPSTVHPHNKIAVRFHPNADQVLALRAQNILPNLPLVPTSSIKIRAKEISS